MSRPIIEYEIDNLRDWTPIKKLADAIIEKHISMLVDNLEWLKDFENGTIRKTKKIQNQIKLRTKELNHAYIFLTSEQVTVLSNHETSGVVMCEKINKNLLKKYNRKFLLKYLRMIQYV